MAASLICVDISSESEDECPPGAKRRRLDKPRNGTAKQSLPEKLMNIPKAAVSGGSGVRLGALSGGAGTASNPAELQPLKSMHIPSGITITKHGKNAAAASSNGMVITSIASMHEYNNNSNNFNNNNNNSNSNNNNNSKHKPQRTPMAQKTAYPSNSKALGQSIMITSVSSPSHQAKPTLPTLPVKLAPARQHVKLTTAQQVKLTPVQPVKTPPTTATTTTMTMPNLQAKPVLGYQAKALPTLQVKTMPTTATNQAKPTPNFQVQQTSVYRMKGAPLPTGYQMMAMPTNQPKLTPTSQLKPMPSNQITVSAVAPKLVSPQQQQLPLAAGPAKNQLNAAASLQEKTTARLSLPTQKMTAVQIQQHLQQQQQ
ncbi:daxx-like protein, partial [Drosophila obscura]|uniref:daxx-like protein n=1 Tax=Drosophila obscura TaxID=7282 RepID=UPI001BB1BA96